MKNILIILSVTIRSNNISNDQGDVTKQFKVDKGGNLIVQVSSGDIRVYSWGKDEVSVNVKGIYEDDFKRFKINKFDNTVELKDRGWGSDNDIEIHIPSSFNIDLKSGSGNLNVLGSHEGNLEASTGGGDISLDKIKGKVNVNTAGGNISCGEIIGDIVMKTSGGDISLKSVSKNADITTNGGDIKIGEVGNYIKVTTFGGDIKIEKIGGSVETVTYGGDIVINKVSGNVQSNTYGGDITLAGANGLIKAKSGGGDITLKRISGSILANTGSGDVYAELDPNGKENTEIHSGSGTIKLFLPENSRVNIVARIRDTDWDEEICEIKSDFKAESYVKNSDKDEIRATYIINGGGEKIILETTNSDIEIKKLFKY
jgi:hypothetical protein